MQENVVGTGPKPVSVAFFLYGCVVLSKRINFKSVTQADMCRRSDTLKRKPAVSNGKAVCGAGFRRKGGIGGKTQNKALPQ